MSEQHPSISSQNHGKISWWRRLCRWLWKYPLPFLLSTILINVAINIGSTALITSNDTKAIPDTSWIGRLAGWIGTHWFFSLLIGTISVVLLFITWIGSREPKPVSSIPAQVHMSIQDRERMLRRLRLRYEQSLTQSLQGAIQIELGLASRPAAIHNAVSLSLRLPEQPEQIFPAHTSIIDAYKQAQQELLILGEPGAGKSTLLLELALHLVGQAEQDAMQPLPILLPLSSWAAQRNPLQDWLIEQFALLYNIPLKLSQDWIQARLVLPLLDGLDEMDPAERPICIEKINTYHHEHLESLVVCSRTQEYEKAVQNERLALNTAVVVQPLSFTQVDMLLATQGKPLFGLRTAVKKQPHLQSLATTPLMLSILMLTYHGTTMRELPKKGALLLQQVWTDYVAQMVRRKGNEIRYPLERTQRWLTWLAQQIRIHPQTIFYAEHLEIDWLPNMQQRIAALLSIYIPSLIIGIFTGILVFFFIVGTFSQLPLFPIVLLGGFVGSCLSQNASTRNTTIRHFPLIPKHANLPICILLGILVAICFGFSLGQNYSLNDWMRDASILGFGSGLSAWVFQVLLFRRPKQPISVLSTNPILLKRISAWFIRIAPQNVWQAALGLGAGMGLSSGLSSGMSQGLNNSGLVNGLNLGLTQALSIIVMAVLVNIILDVSLGTLRFAERIHWTWHGLLQPGHIRASRVVSEMVFVLYGLSIGLSIGLTDILNNGLSSGLIDGLINGLTQGLSAGLTQGLTVGLSYWLLLGLYQGMKQEHLEDQNRQQFNQGIRRSLRNGILVSLVSASIIAGTEVLSSVLNSELYSGNNVWIIVEDAMRSGSLNGSMIQKLPSELNSGLSVGLTQGLSVVWISAIGGFLIIWAISGGLTILRHYIIRWFLARSHCFPWRIQAFLDDTTARIFLQRVGGGYSFTHQLLLEYFADLETTTPPAPLLASHSIQQHHLHKRSSRP